MEKAGIRATSSTPEQLATLLERHNRQWLAIIERNKITSN
jgi:hypothetical protein